MSATSVQRGVTSVLFRIAVPIAIALLVISAVAHSSAVASLVIFIAALVALDVAALKVGHDSRERSGWKSPHVLR